MNENILIQENVNNLTSLFTLMGAKEENIINEKKLYFSNAWPNRLWMNNRYDYEDIQEVIRLNSQKNNSYIVSLWEYDEKIFHQSLKELELKGYKVLFEQIGMALDINNYIIKENIINQDLKIKLVKKNSDISKWIDLASESFGYTIDKDVIQQISKNKNIYLLLGYKNGTAVATTLLYNSDEVMGVHLVGVPSKYRKQGIAEFMIKEAINFTKNKDIEIMTLQASSLGLGIYKKLGFKENFILRNYQK